MTLRYVCFFLIAFVLGDPIVVSVGFAQQKQVPAASSAQSKTSASVPELTLVANPATAAQIRELLEVTGATRNADLIAASMIDQMKLQAPSFFPEDFWTDMQQSLRHLDAESLIVPYFQKYYSQADVEKAIVFYKSSAGKRLVAIQPVIMQKTQKIAMQHAQEIGQQVLQRHKAEIETLAKQYQQQHGAGGAAPQGSSQDSPAHPEK